ncbi:murein transglycosylase domain-containing protein [Marinospirillum insulare]|nr:murein transglycosylase domain-containing protein [Marinospirillum insulare]
MDRRRFLQGLSVTAAFLPLNPIFAASPSFEDYKKQQNDGFANYKAELEKDFAAYQKAIDEEFKQFKGQVKKVWGDENIGSSTVYVKYSDDLKTRTIIDYEKGTMTVEVVADKNATGMGSKVRQEMIETAGTRVSDAYKSDPLLQRVEKRVDSSVTHQEKARVSNEFVVGDVLTGKANPTKQEVQESVVKAATETGKGSKRDAAQAGAAVFAFSIPLSRVRISNKYEQFMPAVKKYSAKEKIDPALVLAIMHSESAFNPMAKSHIPAYGLMQIVPRSAGKDASEKVYGKQRLLSASYLYNSDNCIKMGCAYLNILYYRYLSKIENPESRTYCVIAAYNTGAGNVAKAFGAGTNITRAAGTINRMSPQQVFNKLVSDLPYAETQNYMKKVTPRYKAYQTEV